MNINIETMRHYQAPNNLLAERVILVTGASDGIGRVAAKTYAQLGATVLLLGRDLKKLEAVYDEIEAAGGAQPAIIPLNFSAAIAAEFEQLAINILQEFARLDGILHCAAILGDITPLEMYNPDTWDEVMKVNLRAPFMLTQQLLPLLKKAPDASIIFMSSSVGRQARAFWGAYAVSKAGIENLTVLLAEELAATSNIRVNCINPQATRTTMRAKAYPAEDPVNVPTAEQIMPMFSYLMGAESKGMTGQSFDARDK